MSHVLGRVTGAIEVPRGPDAQHRIVVPGAWLDEGACIEVELPRNVTCAACGGGGCDECQRSGALTLRGRKELAEIVEVTLPRRPQTHGEAASSRRNLVIRVPERGGLSVKDPALPRGHLLLAVVEGSEADRGVTRLAPEAPPLVVSVERAPTPKPPAAPVAPAQRAVVWVAVIVAIWVLALVLARLMGWG